MPLCLTDVPFPCKGGGRWFPHGTPIPTQLLLNDGYRNGPHCCTVNHKKTTSPWPLHILPTRQNCFLISTLRHWMREVQWGANEAFALVRGSSILKTKPNTNSQQELNNAGPHQWVTVSLVISSVGRPFWIRSPVWKLLSRNVPCSCLFIIHS